LIAFHPSWKFRRVPIMASAPAPDALGGDHNAALSQDQLDIAQAEAEHMIQPHGIADDLGWEAMAVVGVWF
jgi:hypothetical protein